MDSLFVDIYDGNSLTDMQALKAWSTDSLGVSRLMLKATEGVGAEQSTFPSRYQAAVAAGFSHIGVYHYMRPDLEGGTAGAIANAQYFLSVVNGVLRPQDWVMLDAETPGNNVADWCYQFCQYVLSQTGRRCYIYSYFDFIMTYLQDSRLAYFPLGFAWWSHNPSFRPAIPAPWLTYNNVGWIQYTDRAVVPGMAGGVDANVWTGGAGASGFSGGNGQMILQHPTRTAQLDLVYCGPDGSAYHAFNNNDGAAGLAALPAANIINIGRPMAEPLAYAEGVWSLDGLHLNVFGVGVSGQQYITAFHDTGQAEMTWSPIPGAKEEPVLSAGPVSTVVETLQTPGAPDQAITYHVMK